jgi:adenylate cyclase
MCRLQRGMAEQNIDVPQDKRIELRIGIHIGDIIIEENDIFGDGVNIAVRLEGIAEPGGISISDDTYRQIRGKVDTAFEDMGPQNLKNITEPMRAWRLRICANASAAASTKPPVETIQPPALPDKSSIAEPVRVHRVCPEPAAARRPGRMALRFNRSWLAGSAALVLLGSISGWYLLRGPAPPASSAVSPSPTTSERAGGPALSEQPSLAVLPFANLSGDPALDYFSDGLTEDLTTQLSQNPELLVIARTSALAYKGKASDIRQVGRELGAQYVLEGSVRKASDRVRITAQLIDACLGDALRRGER